MTSTENTGPPRVVLVGQHPLVTQSVALALGARGHDVVTAPWPAPGRRSRRGAERGGARSEEVGLLLSDLDDDDALARAEAVLGRRDIGWTVLAGAPAGPCWGAVLDAGADTVLPAVTDLETVSRVLHGEVVPEVELAAPSRRDLLEQWHRHRARRRTAREGLAALTAREREVLVLLHHGSTVHEIAAHDHVSEATVRSQVRSVRRKLDVGSQIAAVACYELVAGGRRRPAPSRTGVG